MTTPAMKSSAVLVRNMLSQPQESSGVGTVRWSSPSPAAALLSGAEDSRRNATFARATAVPPAVALYDDAERQRLVTALLDLEITKNKEVDHLRLRVAQLTKRNGELEAALTTVHTALEEEAAAALGSERRAEQALLGRCVERWKWRAVRRRAAAVSAASWQLLEGVRAALNRFPASGADDASRLVRKAMEELTWAEKQWSDDRLSYVQQSVDHFLLEIGGDSAATSSIAPADSPAQHESKTYATRSSPRVRATSGGDEDRSTAPRALADVLKAAKRLADRCDGIVTARLQLLQATFLNVGKAEEAREAVANSIDAFLCTPGGRHLQSKYAERDMTNAHRDAANSLRGGDRGQPSASAAVAAVRGDALRVAAHYDVLRDSTNALVATIVLPPAVALLRATAAHDRFGSTAERRAVLVSLVDATEAMLLQHPLSLKVDATLREFVSRHLHWRTSGPAAGNAGRFVGGDVDTALADHAERVVATFCLQRSPAVLFPTSTAHNNSLTSADRAATTPSQRVREILFDRPTNATQPMQSSGGSGAGGAVRSKTPSRSLRWDLVHSVLDATSSSASAEPPVTAAGSSRRHWAAGTASASTAATPIAESVALPSTTEGRLQSARRLLAATSRNAML